MAQTLTTGAVRGRVLRGEGAAQPAVELALRPEIEAGLIDRRGRSSPVAEVQPWGAVRVRVNREGDFSILGLKPGGYRGELLLAGGVVVRLPWPVQVEAGETAELELHLQRDAAGVLAVGVRELGETEELESASGSAASSPGKGVRRVGSATGSAPGSDAGADLGAETALGLLPLEGRQWEAVAATEAAAQETTLAGGGSAQDASEDDTASARSEGETGSAATGLSVAGLPATQDAETVDGLSADQGFRSGPRGSAAGGPRLGSGFAQGAVRSVRVPQTFSAQYGGAAGALVAAGSRSAGAAVHGSAFFQDRESGWAAVNPFAVVSRYQAGVVSSVPERPADADQQFGGALGLPLLRRGRLGVFGAYEGQRRLQTVVSSPQTAGFLRFRRRRRHCWRTGVWGRRREWGRWSIWIGWAGWRRWRRRECWGLGGWMRGWGGGTV